MNNGTNDRVNEDAESGKRRGQDDGPTALRLGRTALFGLVRGIATATGSALIAGIMWWTRDH
ncbi:hypothetical protein [Streptomyces sp. NBC_00151]|uniref:hypothetical protein n=1 Tax=Streptomyces sp. NBC_00151 TaxID=2975669 RepID=UPI002DD874B0|nr:hypothetical protein [Streptomyces sp. NBC_00151]WRZ44128.1 hypothetical protein OG915_42450 [Streptomyces sp. NBC_00151]